MPLTGPLPDKVHFVGTIGLDTAQDIFRTVGGALGRRIRRIPDGEVGGRRLWSSWQYPLLRASPYLRALPLDQTPPGALFAPLVLTDDFGIDDISFGELGYAREARTSYVDFLEARQAGDIAPGVRFQVGLPTPFSVLSSFLRPEAFALVEPAYEAAMLREIAELSARIPHADLAIQLDVCNEMQAFAGIGPWRGLLGGDVRTGVLDRLVRLAEAVPDDVELGLHLCYGNLAGGAIERPDSPAAMIDLVQGLDAALGRSIDWVHMPAPLAVQSDFFEPFAAFRRPSGCELYLGLIQADDGEAGYLQRLSLARRYLDDFGVASGCGIARGRTPEAVRAIIALHARAAIEPQ